jgi:hypothetical protein
LDSLKKHRQAHMGPNPYFFQFVKQKEEELTEGEFYRACVILLELVKLKRGTRLSGWGKKLKEASQAVFENITK